MNSTLREGYLELGQELGVEVLPVGVAWQLALAEKPGLDLWASDGLHPSPRGSYLAACLFYEAFYQRSPVGNGYTGPLGLANAAYFQRVAATTMETWKAIPLTEERAIPRTPPK